MKVVVDTNIFVSALISTTGTPASLVNAWLDGKFDLISHPLQLEELRDVTRRAKFDPAINRPAAGRLVNEITQFAIMPNKLPNVQRSRDPRDDFLLALCEAGHADFLVTGDKADLLALQRHGQTRIGTAAEVAKALNLDA